MNTLSLLQQRNDDVVEQSPLAVVYRPQYLVSISRCRTTDCDTIMHIGLNDG